MSTLKERWIGGICFTALLGVSLWGLSNAYAPRAFESGLLFDRAYDPSAMREQLAPAAVDDWRLRLDENGPRMLGRPAHAKAAELIQATYRAHDLETLVLETESAAPVTHRRVITDADGKEIAELDIYPFPPNGFQPVATPPEGLRGTLVELNESNLLHRAQFKDAIGVVRLDAIPNLQGLDWTRYAQLGIRALILTHPDGIDAFPWERISADGAMFSILSVNFPRLAAPPALLSHIGKEVVLHVESRFEPVRHRTLVGILRAPKPTREALVLSVPYDQYGILPDYAPHPYQTAPLAIHMALVEGLASYRDQLQRDIVFVATGSQYAGFAGLDDLLRMIGPRQNRNTARDRLTARHADEQTALDQVRRILAVIETSDFLNDQEVTLRAHRQMHPEDRRFFEQQLSYTLNAIAFELSEDVLQRRIVFERGDPHQLNRPEYTEFLTAQFAYDDVATAAGLSLQRLMERPAARITPAQPFLSMYDVRERLQERFAILNAHHKTRIRTLEDGRLIHEAFSRYQDLWVFSPAFMPDGDEASARDAIGFIMGGPNNLYSRPFQIVAPGLSTLFNRVIQEAELRGRVRFAPPRNYNPQVFYGPTANYPAPTQNWNAMGYRAFTLVHTDRVGTYRRLSFPDQSATFHAASMAPALEFLGEFALSLAHGFGHLPEPPLILPPQYSGRVYVSGVGRSIIPNFPLAGALIAPKLPPGINTRSPGRFEGFIAYTDPYGGYDYPDASSLLTLDGKYNLQCFYYGPSGQIQYIKDEGARMQSLYRSINLNTGRGDFRSVNLVAFRAAPVSVLDMINPQTLRPYTAVLFLRRGSLSAFERYNETALPDGVATFLPPDASVYATFRAGTIENERVQIVRSFMAGPEAADRTHEEDISGAGYLAQDHPILPAVAIEQAKSMYRLNQGRARMQREKGLADPHTLAFHERSGELLEQAIATEPEASWHQRILAARDALTYSIIIHPILRDNIGDAVVSILWYMGLLIPFMFFFEKLVFGYPDIRKQLAAQSVIFLIVFGLLRWLHPAFELIRSSLMILLGFVILMISIAITLLFAGKFRENLEELKQQRGVVSGAEINTLGVLATAFMLGLNNMHRRKVRTGLTCATLVLITFAMICFTSIYSDFEDSEAIIGRAAYQGLLVKNTKFAPISPTERFAIESRYDQEFSVAARSMYVGTTTLLQERRMPQLEITYTAADGRVAVWSPGSIVQFTAHEPLRGQLRFVSKPYWFEPAGRNKTADRIPVLLSSSMAERLGVRVEDVNAGDEEVLINGKAFVVRGIFDEASYAAMRDLDGRPLQPFDVRGLTDMERVPGRALEVLGDEDGALIDPSELVLAPLVPLGLTVEGGENRLVSLAIDFGDIGFGEARQAITQFLEQRARPAFFGLDGNAYRGSRMRVAGFAGLVDLIIPLFIAALTVLNTMKGSVYERRSEIYVYNAVGIAPKFIFFMFFAEAFVYAVVGCVLGYLLSQGTGTLLTALDLTGGLNMTFADINSIYASLAVVAAVFISTYFPARSAMEIAAPAEESGWDMPEPDGDQYTFNLPFTFNTHERTAVLAFFRRYLIDHGEGGSGPFSAATPQYTVARHDHDAPAPALEAAIWLKPYDLGVSQRLTIATPADAETGDFVARIQVERTSGTREAWQRVNKPFVARIRRQLLHWRAVPPEMKEMLHEEARAGMTSQRVQEDPTHG